MLRHPIRNTILLSIALLLQLGGACASDGTTDTASSQNDQSIAKTYERPKRIPRSADVVREGSGKLKWTADLDGTVYVYDPDEDVIRYTGPIDRKQEIVVSPKDDAASVGGVIVYQENLRRDGYHQIYFAADQRGRDRADDAIPSGDMPADALKIASGEGAVAMGTPAGHAGTVYVYDQEARTTLYKASVKKGATVRVASDGVVSTDNQRVAKVHITKGHTLALYFVRE